MVVEDHEDTRFMLSMLLKMRRYKVLEAADGGEAVSVAERERPSLILMDGTSARPRTASRLNFGQLDGVLDRHLKSSEGSGAV